jgi:hypothetical protein
MPRASQDFGASLWDIVWKVVDTGQTEVKVKTRSEALALRKDFYKLREALWDEGKRELFHRLQMVKTRIVFNETSVQLEFTSAKEGK